MLNTESFATMSGATGGETDRVRVIAVAYSHGNGAALVQRISASTAPADEWLGEYAIVTLTHMFERLDGSVDTVAAYRTMEEADRAYVEIAYAFNRRTEFYPVHA